MPVPGNETLGEMRNVLFTSSYLLDPYVNSQHPCTTQNGILEPACHPTSVVQHRLGRTGPPGAAGCLQGGAGPAWAQPMDAICRSEHWEENGSPSSTAQPKQAQHCLITNNQPYTQSRGAADSPLCSPALAPGHISITGTAGTALLFQTKADYLLQPPISHSSGSDAANGIQGAAVRTISGEM